VDLDGGRDKFGRDLWVRACPQALSLAGEGATDELCAKEGEWEGGRDGGYGENGYDGDEQGELGGVEESSVQRLVTNVRWQRNEI